jgi:hypothetical protein
MAHFFLIQDRKMQKYNNTLKIIVKKLKKYSKIKNFILGIKLLFIVGLNKINNIQRSKIKKFQTSEFNSITIDTTNYLSKLCLLGGKFGTDKSILNNKTPHQHSYTAVYNILFLHLKNAPINIAEIGILDNSSIRMFREYFKNANIDGFEFDQNRIKIAKKFNLPKTNYYNINVQERSNITNQMKLAKKKYDIIIDDSTHVFKDQINVIYAAQHFLKKGGYLIIEDIPTRKKEFDERNYYIELNKIKSYFSDITFISCNHKYNYAGLWHNHKILCLRK